MIYRCSLSLLLFLCPLGCSDTPVGTPHDMGVDVTEQDMGPQDMTISFDVGSACSSPAQCGDDALCIGASAGGFLCMEECQTPYSICPSGGACLPLTPRPESICYIGGTALVGESCETNLDCAQGFCIGADSDFLCASSCDNANPCPGGKFCKALPSGASICVANLGEPCGSGEPCTDPSLSCTADVSPEYAAVFGFDLCTVTDCTDCPDDGACLNYPGLPSSACFSRCESDADCRFGLGFRCLDDSICSTFENATACITAFSGGSLCVPGS